MILGEWLKDRQRLEHALASAILRDERDQWLFDDASMVELSMADVRCLVERIRTLEAYIGAAETATQQVTRAAGEASAFMLRAVQRLRG